VGRRHLSLVLAASGALAAGAAGAPGWRPLATDPPNDAKVKRLTASLAPDRASTRAFAAELSYGDPRRLASVDFGRAVVVAVFDGPTCKPHLPVVSSVSQRGRTLMVRLRGPAPDAMSCHPGWPGGYTLVTAPRSGLRVPDPNRAVAGYA
jgi:hypothetical protein